MPSACDAARGSRRAGESAPTASVSGGGAGVDSVWEQEKLEAWKKPENAAESH
jgi:hypothetical protein